jgi:hypothetical protein
MAWYKASPSSGPTFHRFPTLPLELRLRIWHFALQIPYMINLHMGWQLDPYSNACTKYLYASSNIPRPLLFVNWEARAAALSAYLPGFYNQSGTKVVWINPKLDTLYLDGLLVDLLVKYCVVKWIERVAFPVEDWLILNNYGMPMMPWRTRILCEHMRALREVQLVTWDELKWSGTWISWKNRSLRSDPESDLEAWDEFVKCFIRTCRPTVENFRQNLEQARACLGSLLSQTSVVVRAVALGKRGLDSSWDHELELL